jgi:hypothetical protein
LDGPPQVNFGNRRYSEVSKAGVLARGKTLPRLSLAIEC